MSVAEKMTALADAIREKSGVTGKLTIDGMTSAVKAISSLIVASASGNPIVLNDSTDLRMQSLRLFGKTTQNGIPTPEAPVPLVSAGDGGAISITISGENAQTQTLPVSAPNGLPGIPVTSGGNYTDETGQQWICDEVDFGRGVYVQRVGKFVADGTQGGYNTGAKWWYISKDFTGFDTTNRGMCSHLKNVNSQNSLGQDGFYISPTHLLVVVDELTSAAEYRSFLSENPMTFYGVLSAPIETPLSAEELAAYAALHTNYPNTTILNDGGAGMEVQYVADTKLYIDNKINAMAAAIVNA